MKKHFKLVGKETVLRMIGHYPPFDEQEKIDFREQLEKFFIIPAEDRAKFRMDAEKMYMDIDKARQDKKYRTAKWTPL